MKIGKWWLLAGLGLAVILVVVVSGRGRSVPLAVAPPEARVWEALPRRVTVEVLNSGGVPTAGRTGMLLLRRAGLDVVVMANAPQALAGRERNQVLVRRGDTTGVGRAVEALGDAEVVVAKDESRLVDLTVLLGSRFKVPAGH